MTTANREDVRQIRVEVHQRVSGYLANRKRRDITDLEERYSVTVEIESRNDVMPEHLQIRCTDEAGHDVKMWASADSKSRC